MTLRIRGIDMDMERVRGIFTKSTIPKGEVNTIHTTTIDSTEGRINPWLNQIINNDLRPMQAATHTAKNSRGWHARPARCDK